jgi:hypothetical protein
VRWGPILAGFLTALTALLLLNLLGVAIGLTALNAGTAAAQGGPPPEAGRNSAIWAAIAGILSFLLGGYVAGRTAAVFDRGWGALNGALVFLLGVPITLWLAGQGLGAVLGSLGGLTAGLNVEPTQVQSAAEQAQQAANNVQPVDVARAAERARNAAWGALLGSLLALGASALGGRWAPAGKSRWIGGPGKSTSKTQGGGAPPATVVGGSPSPRANQVAYLYACQTSPDHGCHRLALGVAGKLSWGPA